MLRRAIRPFTVEVRRRPRFATTSNPNAQSSAAKSPQADFEGESRRAEVAVFGVQEADLSHVVASQPTGRILPSLVPDEPRHRLLEDVPISAIDSKPLSRAPKRQSVWAPKREGQASKLPRNSSLSSSENGALAEKSSTRSQQTSRMQSDEGASATPRDPTRAPSQVIGDSCGLTRSAKGRTRTIMARYVFVDKDKPGERWKRRLLRSR
jgi:hypothetical protein